MAPAYEVEWSDVARLFLRDLRDGLEDDLRSRRLLRASLEYYVKYLATEPESVGEIYRNRGNVVIHHAARGPLGIDFAIDVLRRFVLVRSCTWTEPAEE